MTAITTLSIGNTALREGDAGTREARLTVSLSRPSQSEVTVDYATEDGSAREPSDYSKRGGTLSFAPGQTRKVVGVPVRGDKRDEPNEAFLVELSHPRGAAIGDGRGRVTIRDDDEPPPPPSSETRCAGVRATILGSFRGETIIGTYRDDVIVARGGDDRVRGGAGQDLICGGGGEDDLSGGSGHDRLYGQAGNDLLRGQSGHDLLFGGPGDDRLFGDSGGEDGRGNSGEDSLFGGSGNDHLFGGPAVDACRGGSGPNSQSGCER